VQETRSYEPPPAPRVEQPRVDTKQLLSDSGLVMVETDRSKAVVQPAAAEEPAQPLGRPRRERRPASQDEELVQVETKR
jgi:hypothetical protein